MRRDWKTLAGRLDWVVATKRVESARAWSQAAMGPGNHGQVYALATRSKTSWAKRGEETAMQLDTIVRLAAAAKVSTDWLGRGIGEPDDRAPPEVPRYPNLETAADFLRSTGEVSESAIRAVLGRTYQLASDMPVLWWVKRIEAEQEEQRIAPPAMPPVKAAPSLPPPGHDASEPAEIVPSKEPRSNSHIAIARVHPTAVTIAQRGQPHYGEGKKKRRDG